MKKHIKIIYIASLISILLTACKDPNQTYYESEPKIELNEETISINQEITVVPEIHEQNIISNIVEDEKIKEEPSIIIEEQTIEEIIIQESISEEIGNKIVEKPIIQPVKNPTIVMQPIPIVEEFLIPPTVEDFGEYYDKALDLYNAIISKEDNIEIIFDIDNSDEMSSFVATFESKVLNNLFWIDKTMVTGAHNYFSCNPSEIYEEILMFNELREIVLGLGINENIEQRDAIIKINDWMIDNFEYQLNTRSAYLAFNNKLANCDGYARIFERFCKVINVDCSWESGYVKDNGTYGYHAWNKVKLEDQWFFIDVCWNDSGYKNKYLLSDTLWKDHTKELNINVQPKSDIPWGKTITLNNIENIYDIIKEPLIEDFGEDYNAALTIYNAIINKEDSAYIEIINSIPDIDLHQRYDLFTSKFQEKVLSGSTELLFNNISWKHKENLITANLNTKKVSDKIENIINNLELLRNTNQAAGINKSLTEMEAITNIINWMSNNLKYDLYSSKNVEEVLKTKYIDYTLYAEVFYCLCEDIGIDVEIIKGFHNIDGDKRISYWNKVKIGDTWYYTDIWYYFVVSYDNYSNYEYFLSENLWPNHEI